METRHLQKTGKKAAPPGGKQAGDRGTIWNILAAGHS
jgi:hypothetical protein